MRLSKTIGPAEALTSSPNFPTKQCPFVSIDIDTLLIAAIGDAVVIDRIYYLKGVDDKTLLAIPLMGTMKIRNGQVYE